MALASMLDSMAQAPAPHPLPCAPKQAPHRPVPTHTALSDCRGLQPPGALGGERDRRDECTMQLAPLMGNRRQEVADLLQDT